MITRMDNLERNVNELKELKNTRTSRSMHKLQQPNSPSRRKNIRGWRSTQWNIMRRQDERKKCKKEWTKSPRNVGLCEETESMFDRYTWMWWRERIQAVKYSSGYYPGKLAQPSKAGQYSSPGNTENTSKIFHKKSNPKGHIVRLPRVEMKKKKLSIAREKGRVTHKGKPMRLTADLLAETLQARRELGPIFNILKEKNFQHRISYPAKLSLISEGKIKSFTDKQMLRDFITTRPALQELLKEALNMETNNQYQPQQKRTKR